MAGYLFYDDETQGGRQRICQVAWVMDEGEGKEPETFQTLVDPRCAFDPYVVRNVHHISARDVRGAPTFDEVWRKSLAPRLAASTLVAHNARGADIVHMRKSLAAHGIAMPRLRYVDTMDMARELLPDGPWRLSALARRYGIEDPAHHDALNDALVLRDVFAAMVREGAVPHVRVTETS